MTPYELRFEIFKQAQNLADNKFLADVEVVRVWNEDEKNTVKMEYPEFPTFEHIEELANKINNFVSSK